MSDLVTALARETLVIGEGETVEYVNLPLDGAGMDLTISGTVGSVGYYDFFPKNQTNTIKITETGVVTGGFGIELLGGDALKNAGSIDGTTNGVFSAAGGFTLINTGTIYGGYVGVTVKDLIFGVGPAEIQNQGSIEGYALGVYMENEGFRIANGASGEIVGPWAMNLFGNDGRLVNNGLILGEAVVVQIGGDNVTLLNAGTMEATADGSAWGHAAVMVRGDGGLIASSGSILSAGPAVLTEGAGNTVLNSGLIETTAPDALAVSMSGAGAVFVNTGAVIGEVALGTGGDAAFRNAGTVQGGVSFDSGNDAYDGTGGSVSGVIRMGAGHDRAQGGAQGDVILGGAGRDGLDGGAGNDLLAGGSGGDVFVFGSASGDDVIADFGRGADRLDLGALGVSDEAAVLAEATDTAQGVVIDLTALGGDGSVLLAGVALGDLGGDFLV